MKRIDVDVIELRLVYPFYWGYVIEGANFKKAELFESRKFIFISCSLFVNMTFLSSRLNPYSTIVGESAVQYQRFTH